MTALSDPTPELVAEPTAPAVSEQEREGEMPEGARRALRAAREDARTARREAAQARAQLVELTEAQESAERTTADLTARATAAEDALAAHEDAAVRVEALGAVGLPATLATRLRGETPEELAADAEALAASVARHGLAEPRPSFDGGARLTPPRPRDGPEREHGRFLGALASGRDPFDAATGLGS